MNGMMKLSNLCIVSIARSDYDIVKPIITFLSYKFCNPNTEVYEDWQIFTNLVAQYFVFLSTFTAFISKSVFYGINTTWIWNEALSNPTFYPRICFLLRSLGTMRTYALHVYNGSLLSL